MGERYRYMEGNGSAAMLAAKRLAGVTSEVNLREHVICTHVLSANKGAQSCFETQRRRHQNPGSSVAPQKGLLSSNFFFKKEMPQS